MIDSGGWIDIFLDTVSNDHHDNVTVLKLVCFLLRTWDCRGLLTEPFVAMWRVDCDRDYVEVVLIHVNVTLRASENLFELQRSSIQFP